MAGAFSSLLRSMLYSRRRTTLYTLALLGSSAYLLSAAASSPTETLPSDYSSQRTLEDPVGYIMNYMSIQIIFILVMLLFSSYLTGLNIGLLSLDKFDLLILIYSGTESERYYAGTLLKFLINKHQSLLTILIIKTFCEALFTLLLDNLISQILDPSSTILITAITSSLVLLTFGEIIPQSLFLQFGMKMSSRTRYFFYILWYLTYPLSFPISLILDSFIGNEKPKNSNQILSMRELFQQIIDSGNEQHIKLLLYGLGIKDSIRPFLNVDFSVMKEKDFDKSATSRLGNDSVGACALNRLIIFLRNTKTPSKYIENEITAIQLKSLDITFTANLPDTYNSSFNSFSASPKISSSPQFVVAKPNSKISKVLSEMHQRNLNCAIIFQKGNYVPNRIIGGYILKNELIEQLFSNTDDRDLNDLEKSPKYPEISNDHQQQMRPSSLTTPEISPNRNAIQSYTADSKGYRLSKGRAQWLKFLVSKIVHSKCLPMPVDYEKLKNVIQKDFILCSVNDTNFSHPHLILKHAKPSQIVILTVQGYLPVSLNWSGQTGSSDARKMKVYIPPMTLLGSEFIDDLQHSIQSLDANQLQNDTAVQEMTSSITYLPQVTMELCKKGHYATYLVLTASQLVDMLAS